MKFILFSEDQQHIAELIEAPFDTGGGAPYEYYLRCSCGVNNKIAEDRLTENTAAVSQRPAAVQKLVDHTSFNIDNGYQKARENLEDSFYEFEKNPDEEHKLLLEGFMKKYQMFNEIRNALNTF